MTSQPKKPFSKRLKEVILGGIVLALIFIAWHFSFGPLPVVREIRLTEDVDYLLPFGLYRWWDIITLPLFWLVPLCWLFKKNRRLEEASLNIDLGLVVGLLVGLAFLFLYTLGFGLVLCSVVLVGIAFFSSFFIKLIDSFRATLDLCLGYCLVFGFGPGYCFGFVLVPVFVLAVALACLMAVLLALFWEFVYWFFIYRVRLGSNLARLTPFIWQ